MYEFTTEDHRVCSGHCDLETRLEHVHFPRGFADFKRQLIAEQQPPDDEAESKPDRIETLNEQYGKVFHAVRDSLTTDGEAADTTAALIAAEFVYGVRVPRDGR